MSPAPGRLVLVATPIGNLGDLSPRAVGALADAALICCEDTRAPGACSHAGERPAGWPCARAHGAQPDRRGARRLGDGGDVAVARPGTPGSTTCERLARARWTPVSSHDDPRAARSSRRVTRCWRLVGCVRGILPRLADTTVRLADLAPNVARCVLYEAPHRVLRTLGDLVDALGADRPVAVARELTKLHETIVRGTLGDVEIGDPRGEYVLVVAGASDETTPPDDDEIRAALRDERRAGAGLATLRRRGAAC